jgi:hypothetical protein
MKKAASVVKLAKHIALKMRYEDTLWVQIPPEVPILKMEYIMIFAVDYNREEMMKYVAEKEKQLLSKSEKGQLEAKADCRFDDHARHMSGEYNFTPIKYVDNDYINQQIKIMYYKSCPSPVTSPKRSTIDQEQIMYTHRNTYKGMYIIPKIFLKYIPMIDCDDEKLLDEIKVELGELKVNYRIYNSSSGHFWIFCDRLLTLEENVKFLYMVPGDHRYPHIANIRKEFVIRALPKKLHIPEFIYQSTDFSNFSHEYRFWIQSFDKYWESDIIQWLITKQMSIGNL